MTIQTSCEALVDRDRMTLRSEGFFAELKKPDIGVELCAEEDPQRGTQKDSKMVGKGAAHVQPNTLENFENQLLEEFHDSVRIDVHLEKNRESMVERVRLLVNRLFGPNIWVDEFGSIPSGLSSNHSDIDLCVVVGNGNDFPKQHISRDEMIVKLNQLAETMSSHITVSTLHRLFKARVPILKFCGAETSIDVDIRIGDGSNDHRMKTWLLQAYANCDPRVRAIVFAVKRWSKARQIGDASKGFLNSYGCTLMVLNYLQTCDPPVLPCIQEVVAGSNLVEALKGWTPTSTGNPFWVDKVANYQSRNKQPIGELLFGFFLRLSLHKQYHVWSVRLGASVSLVNKLRRQKFQDRHRIQLCIEDPFDPTDNVARNLSKTMMNLIKSQASRAVYILQKGRNWDTLTATVPYAERYLNCSTQSRKNREYGIKLHQDDDHRDGVDSEQRSPLEDSRRATM